MGKKRSKTVDILQSLTTEQSNAIGLEVERLMKNEMRYIVNKYISDYKKSCKETWGWEEEDLRQEVMITLFKGLATYKETKKAKVTTYLSAVLKFRFVNIYLSLKTKLHSKSKFYFPDEIFTCEENTDETTVEDWLIYMGAFKGFGEDLTDIEKDVLKRHLTGRLKFNDTMKELKLTKDQLVRVIKVIEIKMKTREEA